MNNTNNGYFVEKVVVIPGNKIKQPKTNKVRLSAATMNNNGIIHNILYKINLEED